ncbi:glycosyltransferase [bacterium]|nr:glycosyltransferase [bacterium]
MTTPDGAARPPSVLFVSTSYPNRAGHGSGTFVHAQARALADAGANVTVVCPHARGLARDETIDGVRVVRFRYAPEALEQVAYGGGILANLRARKWRWLLVPVFLAAMARIVRREARRADIVHAHWTAAGLCALRSGRPVVVTFHGSDLLTKSDLMRRVARYVARRASAVIVASDAMRREAAVLGIDAACVRIVPHAIDPARLPTRTPAKEREIVCVGRLSHEKGPDFLLSAFARLSAPKATLVFVGDGPLRQTLAESAARLGVADRVSFAGELAHDTALSRLAGAAVCVVPSRHEGFGVACLEAMAIGLPVVATRCGGPEELLADGAGVLVANEDAEALSAAIDRVMADADYARALGERAAARARERYGTENVAGMLSAVYETAR